MFCVFCLPSSVVAERFRSTILMKIATASSRLGVVGGLWGAGRILSCRESARARTRGSMAPPMEPDLGLSSAGRVLSIQSHTVHGYVGNKAAVLPLQLLGFDVDPVNSVQFSNHTGYATVKGDVLDGEQLWALIEGLQANDLLHYTHLLTGYIGSVSFLETILRVVEKLRTVNPNLIYVCDPVMGDDGEFYVNPELVPVYREKVVSVATMLTPNHFEAEQLTGRRIETEAEALAACIDLHAAGPSKVVITSLSIDNMLTIVGSHVQSRGKSPEQFKIAVPKLHSYFTGTGDLMTALLLGWSHKFPDDLDKAAELAVSSLQAVLNNTIANRSKTGASPEPKPEQLELRLVQSVDDIRSPAARFPAVKL
ncbi:pyridoxal kinase isoform X1 [Physcomitrium patens]|uniref:pyridoxal kinase n=3 Tax=Physcomitrium patens TaxID=3218 RepID=A0A7I4AAW4_PHYPA|nr:pyridoxal kinase-like isoform X3 [Physcomitrium patens]|eukprot:XP_024387765.1 pyridoxal kinase-like isoform X3 [Physcomitrella patens]